MLSLSVVWTRVSPVESRLKSDFKLDHSSSTHHFVSGSGYYVEESAVHASGEPGKHGPICANYRRRAAFGAAPRSSQHSKTQIRADPKTAAAGTGANATGCTRRKPAEATRACPGGWSAAVHLGRLATLFQCILTPSLAHGPCCPLHLHRPPSRCRRKSYSRHWFACSTRIRSLWSASTKNTWPFSTI